LPSPEWYSNPRPGRNSVSLADGARRRRAVWPGADEIVASYSTKPNFMTWREDVLRLYAEEGTRPREDGQVELKCPPEAEAKVFEAAQHIDPWPMLNKMPCPTLVLWGEKSHLHAFAMTDKVEEAIPDTCTVMVPDTTHFLPQEQPEQVARLIEGFLADGSTKLAEA
jgi:pimeloyl-ACP methyl ester carboxylesterase